MAECTQCDKGYQNTYVCSICSDEYCLSHREPTDHNCVDAIKPNIRPLNTVNWSLISYVVNKFLFVILLLSLVLYLLTFVQ
jgi:hypothetical protein